MLTWDDLLMRDAPSELLPPWSFLLRGRVHPLAVTRFGSWFLLRPSGEVDLLDVLVGEVRTVAPSHEAFVERMNSAAWQEQNLFSPVILQLREAGVIAEAGQCYALMPHPVVGGPHPSSGNVRVDQVMTMEIAAWQSICRQMLGGPP